MTERQPSIWKGRLKKGFLVDIIVDTQIRSDLMAHASIGGPSSDEDDDSEDFEEMQREKKIEEELSNKVSQTSVTVTQRRIVFLDLKGESMVLCPPEKKDEYEQKNMSGFTDFDADDCQTLSKVGGMTVVRGKKTELFQRSSEDEKLCFSLLGRKNTSFLAKVSKCTRLCVQQSCTSSSFFKPR